MWQLYISIACSVTYHIGVRRLCCTADEIWILVHNDTSADLFLSHQQVNWRTTRWKQLKVLKSNAYIPESYWSLWRTNVARESIEGMFRAAGFHLGPGINAAALIDAGRKEKIKKIEGKTKQEIVFLHLYTSAKKEMRLWKDKWRVIWAEDKVSVCYSNIVYSNV